jgi:predicted outer membrane repeat protein
MLESVNVLGNQRGGLLVRNSSLDIRSGIVANHSTPAGSSGAGIVIEGGFLTIENSRINGNAAGANGGAVFCARGANVSSSVIVRGQSRILQNTAIRGGGIYQFQGCSLQINEGVLLEDNTADLDGGAIGTDPGTVALEERNVLVLSGTVSFLGNIAGRDGGAISLAGFNTMEARPLSMARFTDNQAGRHGGAIDIANSGAQGGLRAAQFLLNDAGVRGGAISVGGGIMSLVADCAAGNTVDENYCAFFEENQVLNEGSLARSGGSLSLHGGILSIDGFAFRNSNGPSTVTSDSGGVIAFIDSGFLRIVNSLVYDNPQVTSTIQHLFQLNGGRTEFSFNTMVDLVAGSVLFSRPGATAEFVGNIIAGNNAGITGDGNISGTCNNVQLGGDAVPVDPRFVTTAAGRYRLAEDSPMIGLGLSCRNSSLPADYNFPQKDLDGNARVVAGEEERQVDLGAFEYTLDADAVFANGFEAQPVN